MLIDNQILYTAPTPSIELPSISFYSPLYVGGVDDFSMLPIGAIQISTGFVGCVDALYIDNSQLDLVADALSASQISQCRMGACTSSACSNNGVCVERPAGYDCNCPLGYTGDICEQG